MNTCSDCKFYASGKQQCRRRAPVIHAEHLSWLAPPSGYPMSFGHTSPSERTEWPHVPPFEWCGEWCEKTPNANRRPW